MRGDSLPEGPPDTHAVTHMTVRQALSLPVLRRGLPLVVAGEEGLDRPIRWVHAGEVANMASMVIGGEMLLMTGMGIGRRVGEQRRFVDGLAERQVAALVIELGTAFAQLPQAMVDAAQRAGLPLIALRREIAFVSVTEAIHTEIVSSQYALLRRGEQIQRRLTGLMLDGEGIPEVLTALASTLRAPVFLEGSGGRLLSHGAPPDYDLEPLEVWTAARDRVDPPAVQAVAVRLGGPGDGGGRLLVADLRAPFDALASVVLEHAADIVGLALLRARQEEELVARERGSFLANLADGRIAPEAIDRGARAAGLETTATLLPVAADVRAGAAAAADEWSLALADVRRLLADRGLSAVIGRRTTTCSVLVLAALREGGGDRGGDEAGDARAAAAQAIADALRAGLERRLGSGAVTVAVGRAVGAPDSGEELRRTEQSAASATTLPQRPWHDVATLELRRLLWSHRDEADMADMVQRVLGPLLAHDRQRKLALLPTLEALLATGGRKAETARALHLNRQALYHRLTRIEQLLAMDLSDADQRLTLHVALVARAYLSQVS